MANGATVRLPCTHEISAAAQPFDPQLGSAEGWVGAIVTELADVAVSAVREIEADGLTARTRLQGGDLIARLVNRGTRVCRNRASCRSDPPWYAFERGDCRPGCHGSAWAVMVTGGL